jgi:two-component system, cell cycle sensor histidine kinase and response regulator CckA
VSPSPRERARRILQLFQTTEGLEALEVAIAREVEAAAPEPDPQRARERAAIDEALRAGGSELAAEILESVPGGVVVVSPTGAVLRANAEATRVLGLSYDALTRRFITDFAPATLHEDGSPCPAEEYPVARCLATGQPQPPMTIGVRQPGGDVLWAVFRAVPLQTQAGRGAVVTFIDVTERKRAEDALRRSEDRFRALVERSPDHILVIDREARVEFINRPSPAFSREEVHGHTLFELAPPADHPRLRASLDAAFRGEATRWEGADTRGRTYESQALPLRDESDRITRVMLLSTDVTERRQAEAERRRLDQGLMEAQRLGSLALFAGGVAHDFNNLLVGIRCNVDMTLQRLPEETKARALLEDARRATLRASELIEQLIAYSGQRAMPPEPVDLNALTEEMHRLARATLSKKADVRLELAPSLPPVVADATQARQVVMNLITNASEALGGRAGTIVVRTRVADADEVRGWADALRPPSDAADARYVVVEVQDDGCGMDAATRARIFDPFFSTKLAGRGLGLAAVLGIVRGHRGAIGIESAPGGGATFRVALPASGGAAPKAAAAVAPAVEPRAWRSRSRATP